MPSDDTLKIILESIKKDGVLTINLNDPALLEALAAIEHIQWAHWMLYLQEKKGRDGALITFTMEEWARWMMQVATPYDELSEQEKDSDRKFAKIVLAVLAKGTNQVLC